MPKKPAKKVTVKSIWEDVNKKIKKKLPLTKKDIEPIEYYVVHGSEILDIFDEWVEDQKSLMEKHTKKLEDVKARLLAELI